MPYTPSEFEPRWRAYWAENQTYHTDEKSGRAPYYVLDMFPYPSGAGLHVGHPLGYIASDIIARYKRHQGYEVLHPIGFDAFGLPAEQYALETGNPPAEFTDRNIDRYREQLQLLALSYDWSREVKTSDPDYYRWTQWIFSLFFESWYNIDTDKAEPIGTLIEILSSKGSGGVKAGGMDVRVPLLSADEWTALDEQAKYSYLLPYRMAYRSALEVNWCEALGTVLANDEVKEGVSERGGYPVERRTMQQWFLRMSSYAERLIADLDGLDWPHAIKEMQTHWIGRSIGAEVHFSIFESKGKLTVYTTRPDTLFGVTFLAVSIDHQLVRALMADSETLAKSVAQLPRYTGREATVLSEGVALPVYALHPLTGEQLPIWVASYVLSDYGSGAIMAVPGHDSQDWAFAKKHNLQIKKVIESGKEQVGADESKNGTIINSGPLDGLSVSEGVDKAIRLLASNRTGSYQVKYRLRDTNFGRQRYWGEPFPIIYQERLPYLVQKSQLPVELPVVESYKSSKSGESPLADAKGWVNTVQGRRETDTMPGWAGSAWYYLRYMDPHNDTEAFTKQREQFWGGVDLYVGGSEHATGHLLYARFWYKFLADLGYVSGKEPFKKLINQGMIGGRSSLVYRLKGTQTFVSADKLDGLDVTPLHVDVSLVNDDKLNVPAFKVWREEFNDAQFVFSQDGSYVCGSQNEKMSKRWYNVVTPDDVIAKYGCDAFRLYEMFLGPIEQAKPWSTENIEGTVRFLRKFWALYINDDGSVGVTVEEGLNNIEAEKIINRTIKRITEDIERFGLNTCISTFMIAVNELSALKCRDLSILKRLLILISPFAPHIAEELWMQIGNNHTITREAWPVADMTKLVETQFEYPVSFNGKTRFKLLLDLALTPDEVSGRVRQTEEFMKWTEGKEPKKVIVVSGRIVNIVF